jgi:hypothetical protein
MTRMWSASRATTDRSWLMSRMDAPRAFMPLSWSSTCACTVTSSAVVGSSAITMSGSRAIAEAMRARCRRPPESSCGRCRARSAALGTPTRVSSSSTRERRASRSPQPCTRSGSAISRPTGRSGSSETRASCRMNPTSRPRTRRQSLAVKVSTSAPCSCSSSASTIEPRPAKPTRARAVTLLPEPDSPTIATHCPGSRSNPTPATTSRRTPSGWNATRRLRTRTRGSSVSSRSRWSSSTTSRMLMTSPLVPVLPAHACRSSWRSARARR